MKYILNYKNFNLNRFELDIFLNEGLIISFSYNKFLDIVNKFLNNNNLNEFKNYKLYLNFYNDHIQNIFFEIDTSIINNKFNFYKNLFQLINNLGYFISYYINLDTKEYISDNNILIQNIIKLNKILFAFNKKFDIEDESNNKFYYHVTSKTYINKILKNGLIPKSKNINAFYSDRIYLTNNINTAKDFIKQKRNLYIHNNTYFIDINNWIIIKIDISKMNKIKIMKDPYYNINGFYTLDNIPKYAFIEIEEIHYKNK